MKRLPLTPLSITDHEFDPNILRVISFDLERDEPVGSKLEKRYVWDYEIEFITYSKGGMEIDDAYIDVEEGDIILKRPGQYTRGYLPYCCYVLGVDMSVGHERQHHPNKYGPYQYFIPNYDHPLITALPTHIHPKNPEVFRYLFREIIHLKLENKPLNAIRIKSLLYELLIKLYDASANSGLDKTANETIVDEMKRYMDRNFNLALPLDVLSQRAGMSSAHFQKLFKKVEGESPSNYLQKIRVDKAKAMLVMERWTIMEVAVACGFESATYFATVFRKSTFMSPTTYRKRYKDRTLRNND